MNKENSIKLWKLIQEAGDFLNYQFLKKNLLKKLKSIIVKKEFFFKNIIHFIKKKEEAKILNHYF